MYLQTGGIQSVIVESDMYRSKTNARSANCRIGENTDSRDNWQMRGSGGCFELVSCRYG